MIKKKEFKKLAIMMINACKRLYLRGILSGVGGNISMRTSDPAIILCSPAGAPIMDMLFDDICVVDITDIKNDNYEILKGKYRPTS